MVSPISQLHLISEYYDSCLTLAIESRKQVSDISVSVAEDAFCLLLTRSGKIQAWERVSDTKQPKRRTNVHFTF